MAEVRDTQQSMCYIIHPYLCRPRFHCSGATCDRTGGSLVTALGRSGFAGQPAECYGFCSSEVCSLREFRISS